MKAVSYRWLVRWLCGYFGWDNTRALPACVYNDIRQKFQTAHVQGIFIFRTFGYFSNWDVVKQKSITKEEKSIMSVVVNDNFLHVPVRYLS